MLSLQVDLWASSTQVMLEQQILLSLVTSRLLPYLYPHRHPSDENPLAWVTPPELQTIPALLSAWMFPPAEQHTHLCSWPSVVTALFLFIYFIILFLGALFPPD